MSDDRELRPTPILASDAERERSITLLRDAVGEGDAYDRHRGPRGTLHVRTRPTLNQSLKRVLKG